MGCRESRKRKGADRSPHALLNIGTGPGAAGVRAQAALIKPLWPKPSRACRSTKDATRHGAGGFGARTGVDSRGYRVQEGRARLSALVCADTFELTDRLFDLGWVLVGAGVVVVVVVMMVMMG